MGTDPRLRRIVDALNKPCPELDGPDYLIPDEWVPVFQEMSRRESLLVKGHGHNSRVACERDCPKDRARIMGDEAS